MLAPLALKIFSALPLGRCALRSHSPVAALRRTAALRFAALVDKRQLARSWLLRRRIQRLATRLQMPATRLQPPSAPPGGAATPLGVGLRRQRIHPSTPLEGRLTESRAIFFLPLAIFL